MTVVVDAPLPIDLTADLAPPKPDLMPDLSPPDAAPAALCTPSGNRPTLKKTLIAGGLSRPIQIVGPPDEADTLWVIEHRSGKVRIIRNGVLQAAALATVSVAARSNGEEEGLLSITLAPDYAQSQLFYLFYSSVPNPTSNSTIDEFRKTGANTATFVRNVYSRPSSHWFHNGGAIAFNPVDKQLYVSIGDNQADGGPTYAQLEEGDWGRVLKVNLSTKVGTTLHYGLRNPYRFSFDAQNGDLYIGDVGESGTNSEKVFYSAYGSTKTNFGWGGSSRPPALDQTDAGTPIIGGFVYRGTKMPGLCGYYVYGRYNGGPIKTLKVVNGQATQITASAVNVSKLSSLGTDAAGELYFSELVDGDIYRIDPN
jgi:glucose/arabinose dehydrogenase